MATTTMAPRKTETETKAPARGLSTWGDFPFAMSRMRDEFDRLFERMMTVWPGISNGANGWRWGLDVEEKEDQIVVRAEAPGFEPGDFDVNVEDQRLVLRACKKTESKDKDTSSFQQRECFESITLPVGIEREKVEASYHNGVLTICMPKSPNAKAKKIPVKSK